MKPLKLLTMLTLALTFCVSTVTETSAEISNAAVLFLRIAPGARSAGMGESFVAIADDATATHWNPAGLGSYPLADSWDGTNIPEHLRPIKALAALKKDGGKGHLGYDLWAITPKGMARYDYKNWNLVEVFTTRTNETLVSKVKSYFTISDDEKLSQVVKRVAATNNKKSFDYLQKLHDTVMAAIPESYSMREQIQNDFDSLLAIYDRLLINWSRVKEIDEQFKKGMKDGQMSEQEIDRLSFAVEKSRNRFIPEEIELPYSAMLEGEPFDIAASEDLLLVATTINLYAFDGRRWRLLESTETSFRADEVNTLYGLDKHIFVGTDDGIMVFSGTRLRPVKNSKELPVGKVTAIGGADLNDIWIVLDNDLYHFDGISWTNTREYTIVLDDTPESIAMKFSIYGSAAEKAKYIEKLGSISQVEAVAEPEPVVTTVSVEHKGLLELMQEMNKPVESTESDESETTETDTTDTDSKDVAAVTEEAAGESSDTVDTTTTAVEETAPETADSPVAPAMTLTPGDKIRVPFLAEIKGDVNAILIERDRIWLGTEYGVVYFNGSTWVTPGYEDKQFTTATNLTDFVSSQALESAGNFTVERIRVINDLAGETISEGTTLKLYKNSAASEVYEMAKRENKIYFATANGLLEFDGKNWSRSDMKGLGKSTVIDIRSIDNELWVASENRVVTKANGRTNISTMYVKWLPDLADDLYYAFGSIVVPKSGWGTLGFNITFISYGSFTRTGENSPDPIGEFESFDVAATVSFGAPLTSKLAGGVSAKVIYSKLAETGAGIEKGEGTSTGFAIDLGLLYHMNSRLTFGLAVTNLGPQMTYIDAAQADDLPRNLGLGFAYKLLRSEYYRLLVTAEMNKLLVGVDDGFSQELKEAVFNGGAEFMYANIFAVRAGYIYDQEGKVKSMTLGAGLAPLQNMRFDFSYIPSNSSTALANTLRLSLAIIP